MKKKAFDDVGSYVMGNLETELLPERVMKWAGLEDFVVKAYPGYEDEDYETAYSIKANKRAKNSLADHNDNGRSFKYIANIIDKNM